MPDSGGRTAAEYVARHMRKLTDPVLSDFLDPDAVLVPAPGHAKRQAGALWVPLELASAMVEMGFGGAVVPCLQRAVTVTKSAFAAAKDRPDAAKHFETVALNLPLEAPTSITVVDDVVTSGSTLLAMASVLAEAYPEANVRVEEQSRRDGSCAC